PAALLAFGVLVQAQTTPAKPKPAGTPRPKAAAAKKATAAPAQSKPAAPGSATTPETSKAVITVGPERITAREFEAFLETLPAQYRSQAQGPMKKQLAEQLARVKLLAAEARRQGLDKDATLQTRIALSGENMLAGAAYNDMLKKAKVDDVAVKRYYDEHKGEYEEAQARHILIRFKGSPVPLKEGQQDLTEEQALAKVTDIRKRLVAGEDFAELAKKESDDSGSGANGGDLGTFKRGTMVPAFDQSAFSQPVGQLSEPLKTQFGYHIIKVDKRDSKSLDEVRSEIEERIRPESARNAVEALAKGANIQYDDSYFGPPAAPAGQGSTPLTPAPKQAAPPEPAKQP
ncbi:MAG TPA: peptidylprolyl isomerase, partial [Bryobacteraceae bacterium]|nr:peptidylprolyl isomerase [Bryobacteraceae bacterium]